MGRWNIIAGSMQLLMLIALSVDMAHITSRSTTHHMCSDDEYYDGDRDSCFDLCRGKKCLPHQICTERIYGYQGPYICGDLCFQTCTLPMYCNTETAYCNPCSNICSYSDKDMLRQCRIHCYDIYKDIAASGFQTSTAPLTATDSLSIIGPICFQNEYYDADRDMCLDICGESKWQLDQICSTKVGGYTGPNFCVDRCKPTCDSPLYCSKETGKCEPCLDICNDQNEETLQRCRIYCYDIYEKMVVSRTSTAVPLVSTSSEPPPTSDETISSDPILVSTPPQLSPGLVAVSVLVPVVICGAILSAIVFCIRKRRLQQQTEETLHTEEAIPLHTQEATPLRTEEAIPLHTNEDIPLMSSNDMAEAEYKRPIPAKGARCEDDSLVADHTDANSSKSFVECLNKSRVRIVQELEELDDILGYLVSNHAITGDMNDEIVTQNTERIKVRKLLDCVHRLGEEACRGLVVALRDTEQIHLCELSASLKEELDQVPVRDVLSIDQYMTEMKGTFKQKIENRNKQEHTQYGNSISLDQHQPVIINHGHRPPDAQTRQGLDEFHIQKTDRQQLTLDGIFLTDTDRRKPHSLFMLGGPGMGKTSLCFTILNRFVCGQWGGHHFIFLMLLKELGDMGLSLTLADLLFDYTSTGQTKTQKRKLIRQLHKRQDKILFILDGYDEHEEFMTGTLIISDPSAKAHPSVILRSLVRGAILPESQTLLTSRPFRHVDMKVDRVVELAGLANDSVRTLLSKYLVGELESAAEFLENHPDVASMLSIPINIQKFLSYLIWIRGNTKDIISNLPKTKSSLYSKQMLPVLTQCLRSEDILLYEEDKIWRHPIVKSFLCKLAKLAGLAISKFKEKQILFKLSDLERCELREKDVKTGGLMSMFTKQTETRHGVRPVVQFYFNHLTTLEWCGGLDTASRDIQYITNLIEHNDGILDVVLIFCAGLLGATEGQLILKRLYGIPEQDCQPKAQHVLNQIVGSDRCKKSGGPQFAIEVFFEASFVDPRPLLPLLAPDGQTLEIGDIAMSNRQAVGYFVEQLNSSQDEQTGATGTPDSETCLDTVRLHFTRAADHSVQNSMVTEVAKLKKLKHLLIDTDGECEVVVERPLDMLLMMFAEMTKDNAARVIETSRASTLCLYSRRGCDLPGSTQPSEDLKEILLMRVWLHSDMMRNIEAWSSLRVIMWLWYDDVTAADVRRLIHKTPALQAVGLWLYTDDEADCIALSRVVSASSVACLSLMWVEPDNAHHMEVIRDSLDNASLRELWLVFRSRRSAAVLANLAEWVCRHGRLTTLSLVCYSSRPINVSCFLRQLVDKPHSLHHIYTDDDISSVEDDVARSFTGVLQQVSGGEEAAYFTPLVYSDYLLTSIPSHTKKFLTRRYLTRGAFFTPLVNSDCLLTSTPSHVKDHMTTATCASVTGKEIHEERELTGATISENTWRFEICNKTDYLKSGSILPYPMEVFVPTQALTMDEHTKLKVTVNQIIDPSGPSPSIPGNRQFGPNIRFEADQTHEQFVRPLLVFIRFPEEFQKHTDDYEYCVHYNSGEDIQGGIWSEITGYREGQVSGTVIPSHQTAVLLLPHFSWFSFFKRCKMLNVELYAKHVPEKDTHKHNVLVTCLVYLKPLRGTAEYEDEVKFIKERYRTSEAMALPNDDKVEAIELVGHQDEPWYLKDNNLKRQEIQIRPLLENNFMKKHFIFQSQGQSSFSCHIEAKLLGCSVNPQVLMSLQDCNQAGKSPSAEDGNDATCDRVKNTKPLSECIKPSFVQHLSSDEQADLSKRQESDHYIRKVLHINRVILTESITVDDTLWNHLIEKRILSLNQRDRIKKKYSESDWATGLIDCLHKRPCGYEAFRECLCATNQEHVLEYLPQEKNK